MTFIANETFTSLDEIQNWVLNSILEQGEESAPRRMRTLELYPVTFVLNNPRSRCVTNASRRWSLPLAIGEFCWHVSGSNDVRFIEYYAPQWKQFAEKETILGSCYGYQIFHRDLSSGDSQWDHLVRLLRQDPESRRAVITFASSSLALSTTAKDVACTNTLQFLIRSGRVHAFVCMRSNDAIWGLPYDVFFFTMLQELLACELDLDVGTYSHFAASLHLYERHFELAQRIVQDRRITSFEMPQMTNHNQLEQFLRLEGKQREGRMADSSRKEELSGYWQELLGVLEWYGQIRRVGGYPKAVGIGTKGPYAKVLQNLLPVAEPATEASRVIKI
jgi:thymidylate synthase